MKLCGEPSPTVNQHPFSFSSNLFRSHQVMMNPSCFIPKGIPHHLFQRVSDPSRILRIGIKSIGMVSITEKIKTSFPPLDQKKKNSILQIFWLSYNPHDFKMPHFLDFVLESTIKISLPPLNNQSMLQIFWFLHHPHWF